MIRMDCKARKKCYKKSMKGYRISKIICGANRLKYRKIGLIAMSL